MDDRGTVSIYLIIVTLLLFLFNAVLIDYARILVAERQTDQAAKVALRSTMSSYNQSLQNKGLFAFNGDQGDANSLFTKVLKKNLESGDGKGFKFVDVQVEESEITTELNLDRGLANKEVFKHQILEEMKYKAPIEIGEAIIEGFLSLADDMEKASVYTDVINEIEGDVKDREKKLDDAVELIKDAEGKLNSIKSKIESDNRNPYPIVNNLEDLFWGHLEYIKVYPKTPPADDEDNEDDEKTDEEKEQEEEEKEDADNYHKNASNLLDDIVTVASGAKDDLDEALKLIEDAEKLNNQVGKTIEDAKDSKGEIYNNAKGENNSDLDTGAEDMNTAIDSIDDYVLDKDMFTNLKKEVEDAIEGLEREDNRSDALIPKLNELKKTVNKKFKNRAKNGIKDDIINARTYHNNASSHVDEALKLLDEGRSEFESEELEGEENRADDALGELDEQMDQWKGAFEDVTGDTTIYQALSDLVIKYQGAIQSNSEQFDLENKDDTADQAMNFIDVLFENLGNLLVTARDELYFNEYILTRFSSHTFPTDGTSGYKFENNQVEYILYGFESFGANYMAALGEIFALRFSINFVDALKKPRSKVFGPYFWVAALADAFVKTLDDMNKLVNDGKPLELIPGKREPRMTYKDHLRLFLFAHPEGKTTERVMAVIEQDTEADLTKASTYVTAKAKSSVELWFLPRITEMLGEAGILDGNVEGKKFLIEKKINYSY